MRRKPSASVVLSLSAGVVLAALSVRGYSLLRRRPGLPAGIEARTVVRVDDFEVVRPTDIEFILSRYEVGESAAFVLRHGDGVVSRTASFAPFFGQGLYPHVGLAVGLFSYALGFLVFLLRWEDPRARLLYGLAVVFAYTLTVHGGTYVLGRGWLSVPIAAVFYLCYPLAPAILLHFSLTFSGRPRALFLAPVYALFLGFGVFFAASVLTFFLRGSISAFRIYFDVFQAFRMAMIALLLLSFVAFVLAYRRASLEEDRARLKWVFLGLLAGLGPFILLDQGFLALGFRPFLSEESATVFFVFIPLGFAFSLFRFRLLDVEVVINRSLVYSTLTIFTAGLYLFSVRLLQSLLSETLALRGTMASLGSALIAASAFHPARRRIQTAVDKAFFRSSYDSKKAVLRYAELCQGETDGGALVAGLAEGLETVIPVERLAVAVHEAGPEGRRFLYGRGWKEGESRPDLRGRPAGRFWARRGSTRTEEGVDFSSDGLLARSGAEVVHPLPFQSPSLEGFVLLGPKRSGQKFSRDDLDFLMTLSGELAPNLERLRLQEEVIYERASREKADELNRLKTDFVSAVSHELRTPMSAIRGATDLLRDGLARDRAKREELLGVLASESGRLSRLIDNILDFGKIERAAKTYRFAPVDARLLVGEAVRVLAPRADEAGFKLELSIPPEEAMISADRDAVVQALVNLVDNALKYSTETKEVEVEVRTGPAEVEVLVRDRGIGLQPEDGEKIFEPFYRAPEAVLVNPKGVGIGLKIVRHIMDAHHGRVTVESRPGGGSEFKLIFPKDGGR